MQDTKPWWASRTVWANLIAGAWVVARALGFDPGLFDQQTEAELLGAVMVVVNLALRLDTKSAVTLKKE